MKTLVHHLRDEGIDGSKELERLAIDFAEIHSSLFESFVEDHILEIAAAEGNEEHDRVYDLLFNN